MDLCEIFAKTAEASSQEQEFMQAFSKAVTESVAVTQAELMSQYTREATETIKNAVGVSLYDDCFCLWRCCFADICVSIHLGIVLGATS